MTSPELPPEDLLRRQASWFAPARAWLLERVDVGRRGPVLDLGAGYGAVTGELARRAAGPAVALDLAVGALRAAPGMAGPPRVGGDARRLPLAGATIDMVFSQLTLLWISPLETALAEVARVLRPGGALVALEPDYGGMVEYPPEIASKRLWMQGLERAGADPRVGRKLPGLLSDLDLTVQVNLFNEVVPPAAERFDLLAGLPLTGDERAALAKIRTRAAGLTGPWEQIAHLPFFLVTAIKAPDPRTPTRRSPPA